LEFEMRYLITQYKDRVKRNTLAPGMREGVFKRFMVKHGSLDLVVEYAIHFFLEGDELDAYRDLEADQKSNCGCRDCQAGDVEGCANLGFVRHYRFWESLLRSDAFLIPRSDAFRKDRLVDMFLERESAYDPLPDRDLWLEDGHSKSARYGYYNGES
jgi:hypothetical protein